MPKSDYLLTVNVKTQDLRYAHAVIRTYFVDAKGNRIHGSVRKTEQIRTQGEWQLVKLKLRGEYPQAAWIGVELSLEQPEPTEFDPLGKHQIILEDIAGGAWFDDIGLWQIPHIQVATQSVVNVIRWPSEPRIGNANSRFNGASSCCRSIGLRF